jgi:hypothetical protein
LRDLPVQVGAGSKERRVDRNQPENPAEQTLRQAAGGGRRARAMHGRPFALAGDGASR